MNFIELTPTTQKRDLDSSINMFNLTTFFTENNPSLLSFAQSFGLQKADCEDIVSMIWMEFYQKIQTGKVDLTQNIKGYLYRLARWRVTDGMQKTFAYHKEITQVGEENNMDELAAEKIDDSWKRELLQRATKRVKGQVSPKYYFFFVEQTFNGKKADDLVREHGITHATAHLAKHRVGLKVAEAAKELLKIDNE
jgi:DNA-directed RNA polymerase specialized sigma24 family protein